MSDFDGLFALNYIYPLALTAYDDDWNAENNTVLAAFTNVGQILVDTASPSYQAALAANPSQESLDMLDRMLAPVGAGTPPSSADVAAAEGLGTAVADPDAALPPIAPPTAAAPTAPALPVDKRFGWVCVDGSRLIVAFRGTQTAGDWIHDLEFAHEPYRPKPAAGTVHQGFQHVYYAIRDSLISLVTARLAGITELIVTGHSLGAALTTLAMPDLLAVIAAARPGTAAPSTTLYNLESPRVGNRAYETYFNGVTGCWRIVNVWDVVPHVPPALAGFVHVGLQLTIDSGFHFDVAANHVLTTGCYPGLVAWNNKHPAAGAPAAPTGPREVPPGVSD